ncbi:ligase-associated DNA damage response endonuclease PdeM [Sphingobacterium shayense]|uniref:ligase-associated DNA damage response endonuclease PdeM n=1 Tax=Sphingobacterium shayense TaxID=626343 RepID=UPI0015582508|nr:ligase-associated DNA damage response endonuclease PdeM [Sphingobacterium shayense]NQD69306.1 ligase-associated DNA damage response endonuclease PdeM [Sphingobacterium shayense]
MNIIEKDIVWWGQTFTLTNRRALFWRKENALILSDLHLGKAAYFRKNGIPMTNLIHQQDLGRLDALIGYYKPSSIILVGDLLHAGENSEVLELTAFLEKYPEVEFILVKGNHDRLAESKLHAMGIDEICANLCLQGIQFVHEPVTMSLEPQISGHFHPGVSLRLPTNRIYRFPAFMVNENLLILPAFSGFTGLDTKKNISGAIYYAFHEEDIFEVSGKVR